MSRKLARPGSSQEAPEIADANKEVVRGDAPLAGVCALLFGDDNLVADAAALALRTNANNVAARTTDATIKMASGSVDDARPVFGRFWNSNQTTDARGWD